MVMKIGKKVKIISKETGESLTGVTTFDTADKISIKLKDGVEKTFIRKKVDVEYLR
ncbi:hypothetical protein [Virgibacillus chiguensis]|uniref:Uncharacterized protein n=1 Tax=Virgibacillus chiguensis TaxID=411959 RepID=A0A1M5SM47_9BACI|nr:hypothetical protein [Virgibacillus chiguensis]SHH39594.1 hypothetical protein SAMN05421807_106236 [Virgibacillus chiguensis]